VPEISVAAIAPGSAKRVKCLLFIDRSPQTVFVNVRVA
jgi:hypothetical protein